MLRWLLSELSVRNTFWHNWQTALFSGWRCCCSLCLFRVSLVLSILPQRSHRWCDAELPYGNGRALLVPSAVRHRKHITSIRPPLSYDTIYFLYSKSIAIPQFLTLNGRFNLVHVHQISWYTKLLL